MYAFSRNFIKDGSIWIDSYQHGIITSCSLSIFALVGNNRSYPDNLCSFNFSWSTKFQKKNSLFLRISYGFHNYRNWFHNQHWTQWSYFTNIIPWIYWCYTFFLGRNGF